MFLNMGTDCDKRNEIVGQINGTNILVYGHVYERFCERIDKIGKYLNIKELNYNYMLKEAMKAIEDNYEECKTDSSIPVWKVLEGSFDIQCDRVTFTIEVSILIKSTIVEWKQGLYKRVADDYQQYVDDGIVKEGDIVIALETAVLTIKTNGQKQRLNFTEFDVVRKLKFKNKCIKIQPKEMTKIISKRMIYDETLCSKNARLMIESIYKRNRL